MLYKQHETQPFIELPTFNQAVDEFFSKMESQKLDLKAVQQVCARFVFFLKIINILNSSPLLTPGKRCDEETKQHQTRS